MINSTPIRNRKFEYVSELRLFEKNQNGLDRNDETGSYRRIYLGKIDKHSVIDLEISGNVLNNSGLARNFQYILAKGATRNQLGGSSVSLTEQTTMANSSSNISFWTFNATIGMFNPWKLQAYRTVPSTSSNTQITLSSLLVSSSNFFIAGESYNNLMLGFAPLLASSNYGTITMIKVIVHQLKQH